MVQGTSHEYDSKVVTQNWDVKSSKKAGYEAIHKKEQEKKEMDKKYGAWGSTFKNRDNFVNMHNC